MTSYTDQACAGLTTLTVSLASNTIEWLFLGSHCLNLLPVIQKSGASVKLTSTAMAKLTGRSVYFHKDGFGKTAQWEELRRKGCIKNSICFKDVEQKIEGDLLLAQRGGTNHASHQFCFAESTGICMGRFRQNKAPRAPLLSTPLKEDEFCPDWIVPTPDPLHEA